MTAYSMLAHGQRMTLQCFKLQCGQVYHCYKAARFWKLTGGKNEQQTYTKNYKRNNNNNNNNNNRKQK